MDSRRGREVFFILVDESDEQTSLSRYPRLGPPGRGTVPSSRELNEAQACNKP